MRGGTRDGMMEVMEEKGMGAGRKKEQDWENCRKINKNQDVKKKVKVKDKSRSQSRQTCYHF